LLDSEDEDQFLGRWGSRLRLMTWP
jgi:hypothetical protein